MPRWIAAIILPISLGFSATVFEAEQGKYPPPRFPSYVKPPKSIEDVMPFARAAVRVRGTKNTWLTVIDKGELTAYRSPEIRALASRYGDPREVLSDDWAPHLPGINAPGRYDDYARDPWKTFSDVMNKIDAGTYEYFYPAVKQK
jgi:hypothetical protein